MPTFSLPIPGSIFLDTLPTLRYALDGESSQSRKRQRGRHVSTTFARSLTVSRDNRQSSSTSPSTLLRVTAAAEYLNISRGQLRSLAHDGKLAFLQHKHLGPWYFQRDDLDAYILAQKQSYV